MTNEHDVPLDQCDVADKAALAEYRKLRRRLLEMLNGDDDHAIAGQITSLLDADLHYRTFARAHEFCQEQGLQHNGEVTWFIRLGFLHNQVLGIRRLIDRGRNVYSLPRIIGEIRSNRGRITRELYVCVDGDPYDPTFDDPSSADIRHVHFDKLSRADPAKRSRTDTIRKAYFTELENRLKSTKVVEEYVNNYVAHAAAPAKRPNRESLQISLLNLEKAYEGLVWTANQLSALALFGPEHTFTPMYLDDRLEHMDNPLCPPSALSELRCFFENRRAEMWALEDKWNTPDSPP